MTTFVTLQNEVQYRIRQRTDLATFVKSKINQAILEVMFVAEPPEFSSSETKTTASGTPNYVLTTNDVFAVMGVSITSTNVTLDARRLFRGDWREFDDMDQDFTASRNLGRPKKWFRYANSIYFYDKVPDDNDGNNWSIRVRTLVRPTALSADADAFPLGLEWEEPTVLRATEKMFGILGDAEGAGLAQQAFIESMSGVVERYQAYEDRKDRDARLAAITHGYRPGVSGRTAR